MDAQRAREYLADCKAADLDPRISVVLNEGVLWLRIERPDKHNALALSMLESLAQALSLADAQLRRCESPDWLRLAVITGAGNRSFAAGGDLNELDAMRSTQQTREMTHRGMAALNAIRDFPQPVLAGLNGAARGGGAELALACDMRVAHPDAAIGFIQGQLNLSPAWGGGSDLFALLSPSAALRVLAEARVIAARDACELGLIDHLLPVAPDGFPQALEAYVAQLAERPTQILRAHKALFAGRRGGADRAALQAIESAELVKTWTHDDHWRAAEGALKK